MRLKQDHDPAAARTEFRGGERRANFCRMMAVVVDDKNAVNFTFRLEPPPRASEAMKSLYDLVERNLQFESDRDCGERVVNIVHARHAQDHLAHYIRSAPHVETRP